MLQAQPFPCTHRCGFAGNTGSWGGFSGAILSSTRSLSKICLRCKPLAGSAAKCVPIRALRPSRPNHPIAREAQGDGARPPALVIAFIVVIIITLIIIINLLWLLLSFTWKPNPWNGCGFAAAKAWKASAVPGAALPREQPPASTEAAERKRFLLSHGCFLRGRRERGLPTQCPGGISHPVRLCRGWGSSEPLSMRAESPLNPQR